MLAREIVQTRHNCCANAFACHNEAKGEGRRYSHPGCGTPFPPQLGGAVSHGSHKNETSDDANSIETADTVNHMVYALILTLREREGEMEGEKRRGGEIKTNTGAFEDNP